MRTIKLELSVKILLGAIALGLFLNAFKDFPTKAHAEEQRSNYEIKRIVENCYVSGSVEGYAYDDGYFSENINGYIYC